MSREFLDLKRDIEAFVNRFNTASRETAINPMLQDIKKYEVSAMIYDTFLPCRICLGLTKR